MSQCSLRLVLFFGISVWHGPAVDAADPLILDLWPGPGPGDTAPPADDTVRPQRPGEDPPTLRLTDVTRPQIAVYRPETAAGSGLAVVVLPGGGFNHLAYDKEGTEVAAWLTSLGVTGVVLKYRCPTKQDPATRHVKPLQDLQRAMRLVRQHAGDWQVDPETIGVMGFSAGGHIAARLAYPAELPDYEAIDAAEELSIAPAFAALVYPAYLHDREAGGLDTSAFGVSEDAPPTFITYAWDDRVASPGGLYLAVALKQAGVRCELHQYAAGGHGFGLRPGNEAATSWPVRFEAWLHTLQP